MTRSHSRWLTLMCLAALLTAAPAQAQEDEPKPKPEVKSSTGSSGKKSGRKPRIRFGDVPEEEDEPERDDEGGKTGAKKSEAQLLVEALATWPSVEAKQASIRLSAQPRIAYPLLEQRMLAADQEWRVICGAAATLGRMGDLRAIELIEAKIQDRSLYQHSSDLLDALARIDPVGAKARLMAHLLHPASAVVAEAAERLERRIGPDDLEYLREILEIGGTTARAQTLRLMQLSDAAGARPDFSVALRDKSADVAYSAATALAADDDEEALELLRRAALSPLDRQWSYGYLGLALRGERTGEQLLTPADLRALLGGRGLQHLERLNRATSAIALADAGYFHEIEVLEDVLDKRVVPALLEAWINPEFWADMKVLQPLVLRRLRRLTGQDVLRDPREWRSWWEEHRGTFTARRVLSAVSASASRSMVVRVSGPEAPGGETTILGSSAATLGAPLAGEVAILLPVEDTLTLATTLDESGILRASAGPRRYEREGPLTITVRAGNRERRIVTHADQLSEAGQHLLTQIAELRERHDWQRFRPLAVDADAFVETMAPAFAADRTKEERDGALAALIVDSLDPARGDKWNAAAVGRLGEIPGLGVHLADRHTDKLLSILGRSRAADTVARGIVAALARSGKPEAHPLLLDFALTRSELHRDELLGVVFENADDEHLIAGLKDARVEIRVAAVNALQPTSLDGDAHNAAFAQLEDDEAAVRSSAVRALGRLRVEDARDQLEQLASTRGELRPAAIEALGLLGGKDSLAVIMGAFASDDTGLRVAAIDAFADCGEPEGFSAIVFAMGGDPSGLVREVAESAIMRIGTRRAAQELRKLAVDPAQPAGPRARALASLAQLSGKEAAPDLRRLAADPAVEVGDEAALALARWRDPGAVERLLQMLEEGRSVMRARRSLEGISLESFGQSEPMMLAALYGGWWELSAEAGPRSWLVDALRLEGIEDENLDDWAAGRAGREIVPAMLKGVRSERWFVRRACDLALRDLLGRKVGEQEPWTTTTDATRMAIEWENVWAEMLGN